MLRVSRLLLQSLGMAAGWALRPLPRRVPPPLARPADTVVLVTLDGVRLRDLMGWNGHPAMPRLMRDLLPRGAFLGTDTRRPAFRIGSPIGISMAEYQAIFSGRLTACINNEDPPPRGSTLANAVQDAFPGGNALGAYATWDLVADCLKARPEAATVARGPDAARDLLAARGIALPEGAPVDAPAFRAGLDHLRRDPPRFLFIGLDESDNAAHHEGYPRYLEVLARYDGYVAEIAAEVASQCAAGRAVTLLVTTDHGRGFGEEWIDHRWNIDGTARSWLFAMGHGIAAQGRLSGHRQRTLYDIRPTVEYLLGIPPRRRWWRGAVMEELIGGDG